MLIQWWRTNVMHVKGGKPQHFGWHTSIYLCLTTTILHVLSWVADDAEASWEWGVLLHGLQTLQKPCGRAMHLCSFGSLQKSCENEACFCTVLGGCKRAFFKATSRMRTSCSPELQVPVSRKRIPLEDKWGTADPEKCWASGVIALLFRKAHISLGTVWGSLFK